MAGLSLLQDLSCYQIFFEISLEQIRATLPTRKLFCFPSLIHQEGLDPINWRISYLPRFYNLLDNLRLQIKT